MKKFFLIVLFCLILFNTSSHAKDAILGSDNVTVTEPITCYEYERYFVVIREDILVKSNIDYKSLPKCMYVVIDNDFMVKGEHFYGIYKDLMFTLKGEMRNTLSIYSIPGKKKIYETAYSGPIEITKDSKLSFWLETSIARNSTLIILLCRRRIKPAMSSDGVGRW